MKKENTPKWYSTVIRDTGELALQRAIVLSSHSYLNSKRVDWLDIEIPVDYSGKSRGKSIDLIGIDEDNIYVICELKFGKNHNDAPEEAATKLGEYYNHIKQNSDKIYGHRENGKPIDWEKVGSDSTRLIVAADTCYWDYWIKRKGREFVISEVEYYTIPVDDHEFVKQKGDKGGYTPQMPMGGEDWTLIDK